MWIIEQVLHLPVIPVYSLSSILHIGSSSSSSGSPFTGPEPVLGLPYSVVKRVIGDWMETAESLAKTASTLRPSWKGLNNAGLLNC